jgi:choline dehydrogenase-like flavoprotein
MGTDFLIVGAGSAGATLASRLSDDANVTVALAEGGRNYRSAETPENMRTNVLGPSMDTKALPEYFWLGYNAQRTSEQGTEDLYWRGKGVGGTSSINGVVAFRAPPDDFDEWGALGITGWSFAEVLPYFMRLEDDVMYGDEWYHGRSGPIPVHRFTKDQWSDLDAASVAVGARLGFGFDQPDMNAPTGDGFAYLPNNSRNDRRVSCNDGYLEPARDRENLHIHAGLTADRVLFEGSRAIGVAFLGSDGPLEFFADEIVLCGGAAGSAAIALRSGLGPAAELRALGIDLVSDLPVGSAVQDHTSIGFIFPMGAGGAPGVRRPVVATRYSSGEADAGTYPGATAGDTRDLAGEVGGLISPVLLHRS